MNKMEKESRDETVTEKVKVKKVYDSPVIESYKPLEIMSKWKDRSSELPGI